MFFASNSELIKFELFFVVAIYGFENTLRGSNLPSMLNNFNSLTLPSECIKNVEQSNQIRRTFNNVVSSNVIMQKRYHLNDLEEGIIQLYH